MRGGGGADGNVCIGVVKDVKTIIRRWVTANIFSAKNLVANSKILFEDSHWPTVKSCNLMKNGS